jgi:hypothetical protein
MTDAQLFTLAMAVVVPLSLVLLSNSRITDTKETLRAEIATLRTEVQKGHAEILSVLDKLAVQVSTLEANIETKLRIHELEHHR